MVDKAFCKVTDGIDGRNIVCRDLARASEQVSRDKSTLTSQSPQACGYLLLQYTETARISTFICHRALWSMFQPTSQIARAFLTTQATSLNLESRLSGLMSINLA